MNSSVLFATIFGILVLTIFAQRCPRNETYYTSRSSPSCQRSCDDLRRQCPITTRNATAGCYCNIGFARNSSRQCVLETECAVRCPRNEGPILPPIGCEIMCPQRAGTREDRRCYRAGERPCICRPDHCRNRNGDCVDS